MQLDGGPTIRGQRERDTESEGRERERERPPQLTAEGVLAALPIYFDGFFLS